jgi:hypothetical protein
LTEVGIVREKGLEPLVVDPVVKRNYIPGLLLPEKINLLVRFIKDVSI